MPDKKPTTSTPKPAAKAAPKAAKAARAAPEKAKPAAPRRERPAAKEPARAARPAGKPPAAKPAPKPAVKPAAAKAPAKPAAAPKPAPAKATATKPAAKPPVQKAAAPAKTPPAKPVMVKKTAVKPPPPKAAAAKPAPLKPPAAPKPAKAPAAAKPAPAPVKAERAAPAAAPVALAEKAPPAPAVRAMAASKFAQPAPRPAPAPAPAPKVLTAPKPAVQPEIVGDLKPVPPSKAKSPAPASIDPGNLVLVGAVAGAFGVQGEVRLRAFTAEREGVIAYGPLYDARGKILLRPKSWREIKDGVAVAAPEVKTREEAEALRGQRVHVPRGSLPPPPEDEFYIVDLLGCRAEALDGMVMGEIVAVWNFGAGDILEVKPPNGGPNTRISFTKEIVPVVDLPGRRVVIDPPTEEPAAN